VAPWVANFLFEAVNFLLLVGALGWLFFKPVRAALDAERDRRAKEEGAAAEQRAQAEALAKEARRALEEGSRETERRRAEIVAAAEQQAARIREDTRQALEGERRTFARELEASRQAQAGALAETIGRIAGASVRDLLETLHGPSLDVALVRGACEQLRALPQAARRMATVECARPLDPESRRLLEDALSAGFSERTVGAGVRITTAAGQVDASALAIARLAARDLASSAAADAGDGGAPDG
jgi:F0F1-type ATP synthase membrane subunit b/b'